MTTKVTEETRKEKKSTPEKMLGWFILAPILLIAVAIIIAVWAKDSTKEVRKATPAVAKLEVLPTAMFSLGCGKGVRVTAPRGTWSREIPKRIGCDFSFERDPMPHASTDERVRNWRGMLTARINGWRGSEMQAGQLPDGRTTSAYFKENATSMAFRSDEDHSIHLIVQFIPKK